MPFTVNGIGTSVCGSRGDIGWGSLDAMEWFVVLLMPVLPITCVHTFDWNGNQYRSIPIRWSFDLLLRTFVNRWSWGLVFGGALLLLFGFLEAGKPRGGSLELLSGGAVLLGVGVGLNVLVRASDARHKAIRRVLGGITIGNCDPAYLLPDLLEKVAGNPMIAHGTPTFAEAARSYLRRRSYARAMWAARISVALENASEGETLTDQILRDPEVAAAIEVIRQNAQRWAPLMYREETSTPLTEPVVPQSLPARHDDRVRSAGDDRVWPSS